MTREVVVALEEGEEGQGRLERGEGARGGRVWDKLQVGEGGQAQRRKVERGRRRRSRRRRGRRTRTSMLGGRRKGGVSHARHPCAVRPYRSPGHRIRVSVEFSASLKLPRPLALSSPPPLSGSQFASLLTSNIPTHLCPPPTDPSRSDFEHPSLSRHGLPSTSTLDPIP
eukprot:1946727-Rhodomonas_salina.2